MIKDLERNSANEGDNNQWSNNENMTPLSGRVSIEQMKPGSSFETSNKDLLQKHNFGFDLTRIQNLNDLFNYKLKVGGLTEEELQIRQEVERKRFTYEKD